MPSHQTRCSFPVAQLSSHTRYSMTTLYFLRTSNQTACNRKCIRCCFQSTIHSRTPIRCCMFSALRSFSSFSQFPNVTVTRRRTSLAPKSWKYNDNPIRLQLPPDDAASHLRWLGSDSTWCVICDICVDWRGCKCCGVLAVRRCAVVCTGHRRHWGGNWEDFKYREFLYSDTSANEWPC